MKDFSFHAEMPQERKSKSASKLYPFQPWTRATLKKYAEEGRKVNICAVATDRALWFVRDKELMKETISSIQDIEDSPVCSSSASDGYLRTRTTRVDEATARKLHPRLFSYLDQA